MKKNITTNHVSILVPLPSIFIKPPISQLNYLTEKFLNALPHFFLLPKIEPRKLPIVTEERMKR